MSTSSNPTDYSRCDDERNVPGEDVEEGPRGLKEGGHQKHTFESDRLCHVSQQEVP